MPFISQLCCSALAFFATPKYKDTVLPFQNIAGSSWKIQCYVRLLFNSISLAACACRFLITTNVLPESRNSKLSDTDPLKTKQDKIKAAVFQSTLTNNVSTHLIHYLPSGLLPPARLMALPAAPCHHLPAGAAGSAAAPRGPTVSARSEPPAASPALPAPTSDPRLPTEPQQPTSLTEPAPPPR